ncbi:MAG: histidinol-phosphate transaminase [Flavobacteriaceae bacterium]
MRFELETLVRKNVRDLKPYSSARDEYVSDGSHKIFLDANENPFDNGMNRYPDPQQRQLKVELARLKGMNTKNLLLGNGSDEVLDLIFRAFCEPAKDNIITAPPTYGMYKVLAGVNGVEIREINLKDNFELNVNGILDAVDPNSKLICICSPNNPTGNCFSEEDVELLLKGFRGVLVLDEAYIDFSERKSWTKKLTKYPNLIITQTFSKAIGMAGIRLGVCWASSAIIEVLNRIKPPYNVNELTQKAALKRLSEVEILTGQIKKIIAQRKWLEEKLSEIPFITKIYPTQANFVLVKVDDAQLRYDQILNKGIVVRNRSGLPLCLNTLRFTVGTKAENRRLLEVLNSI